MAKRAEWERRVAQWRASGLTGSAFAEREGLVEGTLRHWAWQIRNELRHRGSGERGFVEVISAVTGAETIEVVLRNEIRIRVPVGFDETTLQRLLSQLESR